MKFASVLLIASLAVLASADQQTDTANQFVDQFITALKAKDNFDPMELGEHMSEVSRQIGFLNVKIKIDLHKTRLVGLSKAARVGNAQVANKDGSFNAQLQLGDSDVKAHSDLTVLLSQLIHPDLKLDADIGKLMVNFGVSIGADGKPALTQFEIEELKNVQVHLHSDISLLDPILDVIADVFLDMFNKIGREMITQLVKPLLEDELQKLMGPK